MERAGDAERQRDELADAMSRAEECGARNLAATEEMHKLHIEELEEELTAAKGRATVGLLPVSPWCTRYTS